MQVSFAFSTQNNKTADKIGGLVVLYNNIVRNQIA